MIDDRRGEARFWATAAFAVVLMAALAIRNPAPDPKGSTAPSDMFSSERARLALAKVLGDEIPHTVASDEDGRVRERVVQEFRSLGYDPRVEESLACNDWGSCAFVRNVVAEIEGREKGPAILLNAHYDSVAASPGAGDDGVGVAVLLEIARAIKAGAAPERTIRFLVDEGEESGLLGAEAWIAAHAPDETLATVVLEARGTSGPALMFETSRANLPLVRAYSRAVERPVTSSLYFSIYERLPNRTNFTVFKRAGYGGMAIAIIGDPAHYHTPLDNLENLSDESLQHMGDLTLSIARELSTNGIGEEGVTASYFDLIGTTLLFWPESWNIWLAVAGILLVGVVGVVAIRDELASALQILLGWLVMSIAVAIAGGLGWAFWKLATIRSGDSLWLANAGFLVVAAWLVSVGVVSAPYALMRRPPARLSIWTALWLLHGVLGVVCARLLPGAAYLFFIPAIAAGLTGLVTMGGKRRDRSEGMAIVPFALSLLLIFPFLERLYVSLGLIALPGIAAFATLLLLPLLVASTEARRPAMLTLACFVGTLMCVIAFQLTDVHSTDVPRALNVAAVRDDSGASTVVLLADADPLPDSLAARNEFSKQPVNAFRRGSAGQPPRLWSLPIDRIDSESIDLAHSTYTSESGMLKLVGRDASPHSVIRVQLPEGSRINEVAYLGGSFRHVLPSLDRLTLHGVPAEGFSVTATVKSGGTVTVTEERPGLPPAAGSIAALRSDSEVPIGPGDRTVLVSGMRVDDLPAAAQDEADPLPEVP